MPTKIIYIGTYAIQGKRVSGGHYEATCCYCNMFWHKGDIKLNKSVLVTSISNMKEDDGTLARLMQTEVGTYMWNN